MGLVVTMVNVSLVSDLSLLRQRSTNQRERSAHHRHGEVVRLSTVLGCDPFEAAGCRHKAATGLEGSRYEAAIGMPSARALIVEYERLPSLPNHG